MKMIHCADIHLGSKMEAKLPKEKADERKNEVRVSFERMVQYAKKEGVRAVLLSGDVFDSDRPFKKDKVFFYSVIKNNPEIDFFYLRGNHDSEESYTESDLDNLKTFGTEWKSYDYGEIVVSGIEMAPENAVSLYTTLHLNPAKKNIVLLHGQIAAVSEMDKINLPKLRNKYIDYLALGHVHSYSEGSLDERGRYAYCGCLEGRGFDEIGEKGFVLLTIGDKIESRFIPNSCRKVEELSVDISGADGIYHAYQRVAEKLPYSKEDMVRIRLTGEISFDNDGLAQEVERLLSSRFYFVSVKDKTRRQFDVEALKGDISLRGEFIRTVLAGREYTDEQKQQIISVGLRALRDGN